MTSAGYARERTRSGRRWLRSYGGYGYNGGYFWYSPDPNDEVFGINASVMFLGSMSRLLAEQPGLLSDEERRLVEKRADALARAVIDTVRPRAGYSRRTSSGPLSPAAGRAPLTERMPRPVAS